MQAQRDSGAVIKKIAIQNYRLFRSFGLSFSPGINTLVGANDSGKSTLIEAVSLALTGRLNGRPLAQELSPYLINMDATAEYIAGIREGRRPIPPSIVIDLFLEDEHELETLRGTNNLSSENACGIRIQAKLSSDYAEEYEGFISDPHAIRVVPTEYYRVEWLGFSGNAITARSVPTAASVIDSIAIRLPNGVDYHLQQVLRTHLDTKERVELSRQYRSLRETFAQKEPVKQINNRLREENDLLTDRELSLAIDISHGQSWENTLTAHIDDLPFQLVGRGQQNALKMLLAIGRRSTDAQIILIEEPETHLSFASLRKLISRIEERCASKQLIIATHSGYVINKLGLDSLILISNGLACRITDLPAETIQYFKKLPGFDTLRLVLADAAILVEGPSDELIVQRAYLDARGKLPIADGIDVISVGLSHKRFLDISTRLKRRVWIVTDNDGKPADQVRARFSDYLSFETVSLHVPIDSSLETLEPSIVDANDLNTLNDVLGTAFDTKEQVLQRMRDDKTAAALAIFESKTKIVMPDYIREVVSD
jgi:predicted ATPase/5S rRNA maturation endonuclease (ribonuclease M5)